VRHFGISLSPYEPSLNGPTPPLSLSLSSSLGPSQPEYKVSNTSKVPLNGPGFLSIKRSAGSHTIYFKAYKIPSHRKSGA